MDLEESAIKTAVGAFLKEARLRRRYTLASVARALGRSPAWVCDVESGRRGGSHLSPTIISDWAGYLNIPVASIAEKQRLAEDTLLDRTSAASKRYLEYYKILRSRTRSIGMYNAINELKGVVNESQESLTLEKAQALLERVEKSVVKISSCLQYTK